MILQGPVATPPPPPGVDVDTIINALFPLIGLVVGLIVGGVVLYAFFKSDIAAAIAERIRVGMHRRKDARKLGGEWIDTAGDEPRVAQLEERVDQLNGQIAELAERLDFAERLLAQKRERTLRAGE
jgi:TolA-binding protein